MARNLIVSSFRLDRLFIAHLLVLPVSVATYSQYIALPTAQLHRHRALALSKCYHLAAIHRLQPTKFQSRRLSSCFKHSQKPSHFALGTHMHRSRNSSESPFAHLNLQLSSKSEVISPIKFYHVLPTKERCRRSPS